MEQNFNPRSCSSRIVEDLLLTFWIRNRTNYRNRNSNHPPKLFLPLWLGQKHQKYSSHILLLVTRYWSKASCPSFYLILLLEGHVWLLGVWLANQCRKGQLGWVIKTTLRPLEGSSNLHKRGLDLLVCSRSSDISKVIIGVFLRKMAKRMSSLSSPIPIWHLDSRMHQIYLIRDI